MYLSSTKMGSSRVHTLLEAKVCEQTWYCITIQESQQVKFLFRN